MTDTWTRRPGRARRLAAAAGCLAVLIAATPPAAAAAAAGAPTGTAAGLPTGTAAGAPTGTAEPRVASADDLAAGESYLRAYMDRIKAPGLAYAVIRGDEVIRRGTWGVDGEGRPVTARTPFVLGSTSKSFTASAVTQLVEAGRVDLDAAASTYLPWLRLGGADTAPAVTVRQLLTHTSGLPQVWSTGLTDRYDNSPGALARSVRDLATLRPTAPAGRAHEYSDANYMILGALVESVTGESFGAYLRRHLLDPLRMTHSAATADEARVIGVPAGHRYYFGRPQRFAAPFDTAGVPYGFLAAGLDDLSHYAMAQLNGGRYGDTRILRPESTTQMQTGAVDTGHGTYGFGWRNSTLDGVGVPVVWHAGATPNFFTHVVLAPGSGLAVVLMTNVYGLTMDAPISAGAFNLVRILHGGQAADAPEDPTHDWVLAGLLGIAAVLLAAVLRAGILLVRPRRGSGRRRSRGRTIVVTTAWVGMSAAVAAAAAWQVPAFWEGAGLAKVRLWEPDVGDSISAVIVLSAALALARLGLGVHALYRPGRVREQRPG